MQSYQKHIESCSTPSEQSTSTAYICSYSAYGSIRTIQSENASSAPYPKRFRRSYSRTAEGCLTCRRRRKKCDEGRPTCLACRRNNLACQWPEDKERSILTTTSVVPQQPAIRALQSSTVFHHLTPPLRNGLSQLIGQPGYLQQTRWSCLLFDHYLKQTSIILGTSTNRQDSSPFQTFVLQSAASDDLLMNAIIAVSGTHMDFNNEAAPEIRRVVLTHYGFVLRDLHRELNGLSSTSSIESCCRLGLVLLLLSFVEVRSNVLSLPTADKSRPWVQHAARELYLLTFEQRGS